jgi:PAS domain S-box-containing protein
MLEYFTTMVEAVFAPNWLRAALVVSLLSTFVLVVLFAYLNYYTKRAFFHFWTVAWLFYALWLAVGIVIQEFPERTELKIAQQICVGVSALFLLWGSLVLRRPTLNLAWLGYLILFFCVWSYLQMTYVQDPLAMSATVFALLGMGSIYTAAWYANARLRVGHIGATILAVGFGFWGLYMAAYPFLYADADSPTGYFLSAVLELIMAVGMIVLVLQEERDKNLEIVSRLHRGVTRTRLLEQEVSVSEEKYHQLFDLASDAIFVVDIKTLQIEETNKAAQHITGLTDEELRAMTFTDLCGLKLEESAGPMLENKRLLESLVEPSRDLYLRRKDGATVPCEGVCNLVQYNQRPMMQIYVREITERKKMEEQLRQHEKLSALGQMIAGVAHELNNPLAVIMGYSQLLSGREDLDTKTRDDLKKINRESERAGKIVRNLLTFARMRLPEKKPVDVHAVLHTVLELREHDLRVANVRVVRNFAQNLPKTYGDPTHLEQVFMNLVSNAVHAMQLIKGQRVLTVATFATDKHIRVSIADTGPGISEEMQRKIFEPFFTTKAPGAGTGLGLSISYSIIQDHKGKIYCHSEPNLGTTFIIELPIATEQVREEPETAAPARLRPAGVATRRVLIIDDEPGIVDVLKEVLVSNGYEIETATDGEQALECLANGEYDLILSDLRMPNLDGESLYAQLKNQQPELAKRIVFVTGDTISPQARQFLESTGNRWISKPFTVQEIEAIVDSFFVGKN